MDLMKPGSRIRYYRHLLDISQSELAGNCFSVPLIQLIETNKRGLTVSTAAIIVAHLNQIAQNKNMQLTFMLSDLFMPEDKYAEQFCMKELLNFDIDNFNLEKYVSLIDIAKFYSLNDVLMLIYDKLSTYYYKNGNYIEAAGYLREEYELYLDVFNYLGQVNVLCRIGTCYYALGEYDESLLAYSQGYELYLANALNDIAIKNKLFYNMSLCYVRLKNYYKALECIDASLNLMLTEDKLTDNLILKASILIDLKRYKESLQIYEKLIGKTSDNIYIVQNNMGYALKCLGRIDDSIHYFSKSINNQLKAPNKNTTLSLAGIADAYRKGGDFELSITLLEYAIKNSLDFEQYNEFIECCEEIFNMYMEQSKPDIFLSYYDKLLNFCKNKLDNDIAYKKLERFRLSKIAALKKVKEVL